MREDTSKIKECVERLHLYKIIENANESIVTERRSVATWAGER